MRLKRFLRRAPEWALVLPVLLLLATAGHAEVVTLPKQTLALPLHGVTLSIPVSGTLQVDRSPEGSPMQAKVTADLASAQTHATEVIQALIGRDDSCGEQIEVRKGRLGARTPALRVLAELSYGRTTCFGGRQMTVVPTTQVSADVLLHPVMDGDIPGVRAEILSLESVGQKLPNAARELLAATISDRASREIRKLVQSNPLPAHTRLEKIAFAESPSGALEAELEASAVLSRSDLGKLRATRSN